MTPIAVIIPVYRGLAVVRDCLESALSADSRTPHILLVIYDGGEDALLEAYLDDLAVRGSIKLYKNSENQGFVKTINRGFELAGDADCVILNSDTLVPDGWVDRLVELSATDPAIATITPFTNNGEIASFPNFCEENTLPPGFDHAALDEVFRVGVPDRAVDIPTGVGFCMYISRASLDQLGGFDAERFGRGYGEENDYCTRALSAGFRNVLCTNLFVYHAGGESFGKDKKALMAVAGERLLERHPLYGLQVNQFIKADPLEYYRWLAVLAVLRQDRLPLVLVISHGMGGGADKYVDDIRNFYTGCCNFVSLERGDKENCVLTFPGWVSGKKLRFSLENDMPLLHRFLGYLRPNLTMVNHLKGMEAHIEELLEAAGSDYAIVLHDYFLISANPPLIDANNTFSPQRITDDECRARDIKNGSGMAVADWDRLVHTLLKNARFCIAPSHSVKRIFSEAYPDVAIRVAYHLDAELIGEYPPVRTRKVPTGAPVRVGIMGAISPEKGADIIESVANQARRLGLPLEFVLIGYAYRPLAKSVLTHGVYKETELKGLLDHFQPDFIWFPCLCAETFCYTLSSAMEMGYPLMLSDLGALPERTAGRPLTRIVAHSATAEEWLKEIQEFSGELRSKCGQIVPWENQAPVEAFYSEEFMDIVRRSPRSQASGTSPDSTEFREFLSRQPKQAARGLRKKLLAMLVYLRLHPYLAWISKVIPYRVQQNVKRVLSRRPLHDNQA